MYLLVDLVEICNWREGADRRGGLTFVLPSRNSVTTFEKITPPIHYDRFFYKTITRIFIAIAREYLVTY